MDTVPENVSTNGDEHTKETTNSIHVIFFTTLVASPRGANLVLVQIRNQMAGLKCGPNQAAIFGLRSVSKWAA